MISIDKKIIQAVAEEEGIDAGILSGNAANGKTVILYSNKGRFKPVAIGAGVRTKTNANIGVGLEERCGRYKLEHTIGYELKKLNDVTEAGVDTFMDLSDGRHIKEIRRAIIPVSKIPMGTVPLYELAEKMDIVCAAIDDFLEVIEEQAKEGASYMTLHCATLIEGVSYAREGRICGIVSKGGGFIAEWMRHNKKENPLYVHFNEVLKILKKYNVVLSIGDGLRPGATADASDRAQKHELYIAGELVKRAWDFGVQVIVEGPGHVPLDKIEETMKEEKEVCHGAPFYVLGPLIVDNAAGYDHITGGIGAALAARNKEYGADFLCYVTPSEHLHLPMSDDARRGAIAIVKAAEAADKGLSNDDILRVFMGMENSGIVPRIYKEAKELSEGNSEALERNRMMSISRKGFRWSEQAKYALFPEIIEETIKKYGLKDGESCNMCRDHCPMRIRI